MELMDSTGDLSRWPASQKLSGKAHQKVACSSHVLGALFPLALLNYFKWSLLVWSSVNEGYYIVFNLEVKVSRMARKLKSSQGQELLPPLASSILSNVCGYLPNIYFLSTFLYSQPTSILFFRLNNFVWSYNLLGTEYIQKLDFAHEVIHSFILSVKAETCF